jgi:hypothetical protein
MRITLSVPGRPPVRTDPGRCADRNSPNAHELAAAAEQLVDVTPEAFPVHDALGVTVVFGMLPPQPTGYDTVTAIEEVLVDVGVIADESQPMWERQLIDPALGDSYTVILQPV